MANVVTNPTGNQSITVYDLLPNTPNTTQQSLGVSGGAGICSTSGMSVTGTGFNPSWPSGWAITINGVGYVISSVSSSTSLTLTSSAGTQTNVPYSVPSARWNASLGTTDIQSINSILNALDYNSTGTDIGAWVQNAINSLGSTAGQIFIPAGTYTQTSTIYLPPWITLRGAGASATILNYAPTGHSGWSIVVAGNNVPLFNNFGYQGALEDLTIYGPGANSATGGVYFGYSDGITGNSGTCSTSGTSVTGTGFNTSWPAGMPININGSVYLISSVASSTSLTLLSSAGTNTNVPYYVVGSPSTSLDPQSNFCFGFNLNRVRVWYLGVSLQWGGNAWSETFTQCTIALSSTGIYFPPGIGGDNSGENLCFVGCTISNNAGDGVLVGAGDNVNVTLLSCSLDTNGGWAVQNGSATSANAVHMTDCYIFSEAMWIRNYGNMTVKGGFYTGGDNSNILGYLVDNQGSTYAQFMVFGGEWYNGGTGTLLNSSSKPSVWVGALITGSSSALNGAGGVIDFAGNARFGYVATTKSVVISSSSPTAIGQNTQGCLFLLHDVTNTSGTALVLVDAIAISVINSTGTTVFTTGSPGPTEVKVSGSGATIQLTGGSSRNGATITYMQLAVA